MQKKSSKITKNCQKHQKTPAIPTNQLTRTTNISFSHFMYRLWGLQRREVLKSILHCNWEIFISPGNSSDAPILYNMIVLASCSTVWSRERKEK